jgi:hypothetical protein
METGNKPSYPKATPRAQTLRNESLVYLHPVPQACKVITEGKANPDPGEE